MTALLWLMAAYLIGSLPTSYASGRLAGIDLREHGSRNLGATNVYRVLGLRWAVPVGLVDIAKGFVPVWLAPSEPGWLAVAIATAAVLGHVYPLYLGFQGGKGVATAAGGVLALAPVALAVSAAVWATVAFTSRYVSLASLLGAASFPLAVRLLRPADPYTFAAGVLLAVFIAYTHRANVRRLWSGTENRFGRRHAEERT